MIDVSTMLAIDVTSKDYAHKRIAMTMSLDDALALATVFYNTTPDQTYSPDWRLALVVLADELVNAVNTCRTT